MKKEDIVKIKVMQVTIKSYVKYWSSEGIYNFLRQIESYDGFKGFSKISFDVENLPELVCYFELQDKRKLEERLSKLANRDMEKKTKNYKLYIKCEQIPDKKVTRPDNGFEFEITSNNKRLKGIFNDVLVKSINILLDNPDYIGLKKGDIIEHIDNTGGMVTEVI